MIPANLLYTDQHEWVSAAGGVATVGITDHAQDALGDVTFVELPAEGTELAKGAEAAAIESAKAAVGIYAPAAGTVTETNTALEDDPSPVNSDPYQGGWIYKLALADPSELDALLSPEQYEALLAGEED